jgi:hypothetical protein
MKAAVVAARRNDGRLRSRAPCQVQQNGTTGYPVPVSCELDVPCQPMVGRVGQEGTEA